MFFQRLMPAFFALSFFLVASCVQANDLKQYSFTAKFKECLSDQRSNNYLNQHVGVAESSVINGITGSGGMKSRNYWTFMNCLSVASSGSSRIGDGSVNQEQSCGRIDEVIDGVRIIVPSGSDGKIISISGVFLKCSSGAWSPSSSSGFNNGSLNNIPTQFKSDCGSEVISIQSCTFTVPQLKHGQIHNDGFGHEFGDAFGLLGKASFSCNDGEIEQVGTPTCEIDACSVGEQVRINSMPQVISSGVFGSSISCKGTSKTVGRNIILDISPIQIQYYSSSSEAKNKSKILAGEPILKCKGGRWVEHEQSSGCRIKSPAELSCNKFILVGGERQYYCQ